MILGKTALILPLSLMLVSCSGGGDAQTEMTSTQAPTMETQPIAAMPPVLVEEVLKPFHGDFAAIIENREIRVLVTYSKTNFFLDGGTQRGIMQLLPSTAADKAVGIPDISTIENNIHAGTKYLRYIVDHYFDDPAIDDVNRTLFAFASYNAGPNRIRRLRGNAAELGYDPNIWFRSVEVVVADEVGREPVQYVRNIFKYFTAYRLIIDQGEIKKRVLADTKTDL